MPILGGLLKNQVDNMVNQVGNIATEAIHDQDKRDQVIERISSVLNNSMLAVYTMIADVQKAVQINGNWLQKSWRPLTMLMFGICIVAYFFGMAKPPEGVAMELLDIIKLSMGVFIGGRTLEKISKTVTDSIDISTLKRKERTEILK